MSSSGLQPREAFHPVDISLPSLDTKAFKLEHWLVQIQRYTTGPMLLLTCQFWMLNPALAITQLVKCSNQLTGSRVCSILSIQQEVQLPIIVIRVLVTCMVQCAILSNIYLLSLFNNIYPFRAELRSLTAVPPRWPLSVPGRPFIPRQLPSWSALQRRLLSVLGRHVALCNLGPQPLCCTVRP